MSTPTPETALARHWRLDVDLSSAKDGSDWQECIAMTEFSWSAEPNHEESTTYDTDGWAENEKTGQAWEATVNINRKSTTDGSAFHPVHEALRTAAFAWGEDAKVHVRFYDRKGRPEAYEGTALVTWTPSGGEATALSQVEITLTGTGALETITNPITP